MPRIYCTYRGMPKRDVRFEGTLRIHEILLNPADPFVNPLTAHGDEGWMESTR